MLQPTRALGDLELKYAEFNTHKDCGLENTYFALKFDRVIIAHNRYSLPIKDFNGPYITHVPDVKIFDIQPEDGYVIISSDGMWDELDKRKVARIVKENYPDKFDITNSLLRETIEAISRRSRKFSRTMKLID